MIPADLGLPERAGILVDTNLLVLLIVGAVNPDRIATFKRTSAYTKADYNLLSRCLANFKPIYTVAHVLAEVSDLIDLPGPERREARRVLKETISLLREPFIPSARAAEDQVYAALGLVDAAIGTVARAHDCYVLTDDLELYHRLAHDNVSVINFTHLRERAWEL